MTKEARIYNWRKDSLFNKYAGKIEQLHVKESNWTGILYHIQKLTENGLKP